MDERVVVGLDESGMRLDRFLSIKFPTLSRTFLQQLIEQNHILVSDRSTKPNYRVRQGDIVSVVVPPAEPSTSRGEDIPLSIVYEDSALLVVDKPAGMVVHPAAGHPSGTLVNAVLWHSPDVSVSNTERPGIVHRLDRDTSGLILIAKTSQALEGLQRQFASHEVHKTYLGLVHGNVTAPRGIIAAPIGRDPRDRKRMAVVSTSSARAAQTMFIVEERLDKYTLVRFEPLTGRTHQIRVHAACIHHPIVGDSVYGPRRSTDLGLDRQFLHSWRISFSHPETQEPLEFSSPLPTDLQKALRLAGGEASRWVG